MGYFYYISFTYNKGHMYVPESFRDQCFAANFHIVKGFQWLLESFRFPYMNERKILDHHIEVFLI
jgi:hypothetical protein